MSHWNNRLVSVPHGPLAPDGQLHLRQWSGCFHQDHGPNAAIRHRSTLSEWCRLNETVVNCSKGHLGAWAACSSEIIWSVIEERNRVIQGNLCLPNVSSMCLLCFNTVKSLVCLWFIGVCTWAMLQLPMAKILVPTSKAVLTRVAFCWIQCEVQAANDVPAKKSSEQFERVLYKDLKPNLQTTFKFKSFEEEI